MHTVDRVVIVAGGIVLAVMVYLMQAAATRATMGTWKHLPRD